MAWQDTVFALGGVAFGIGLIPSIRGSDKPPLLTSIATVAAITAFVVTFITLSLWLSVVTLSMQGIGWGILAVQQYRIQHGAQA